ncbi:TetR family transcriptional regulator [Xylophilus sp.]|uniref:TetR family transcriptional regulator n=1 Tax=Xylophilus sp. TaxID=2653893 RepID=UPI0013B84DDB|nr:TetR family transcriptional regulator [Xylophilus sp.]KAF1045708.1 MAG: HTH-type transcriptional regulator AcrR [Xylophilus sp.]
MVRKTKEDALATRTGLIDAAERLFHTQGVSRTSLADIAAEAGTTRGAIYWHFKDKGDLCNAMMERAKLPLEEACRFNSDDPGIDPFARLRDSMAHVLHKVEVDEQIRRVFEIAMLRVEYVEELRSVQERHLSARDQFCTVLERDLAAAAREQRVTLRLPAREAAIGLHALFDGLVQNWILSRSFDLVHVGCGVMDAYLIGLGFTIAAPGRC